MPQRHLPFFPDGVEPITAELAFEKKAGQVTYFNGPMPVFIHDEQDIRTFRMITAQFCLNGNATQAEISRAFGVDADQRQTGRQALSGARGLGVL